MSDNPVVNALPVAVILLFLPIVGVEGYFAGAEAGLWGPFNARISLIQQYSVVPDNVQFFVSTGRWSVEWMGNFVLYPFLHGSFLQTVFASVFLLALGKFVGEAMGDLAVVVIFFASSIVGALAYVFLLPDTYPLFGAYPAAYGLIGGFTYVMFSRADGMRSQQFAAFRLIGILMAINLGFSLFTGGPNLWMAELVGALAGFVAAAALRPGGIPQLIETLRRR